MKSSPSSPARKIPFRRQTRSRRDPYRADYLYRFIFDDFLSSSRSRLTDIKKKSRVYHPQDSESSNDFYSNSSFFHPSRDSLHHLWRAPQITRQKDNGRFVPFHVHALREISIPINKNKIEDKRGLLYPMQLPISLPSVLVFFLLLPPLFLFSFLFFFFIIDI